MPVVAHIDGIKFYTAPRTSDRISLEKIFPIMERLKEEIVKTTINVEGRFNLSIVTASFGVAEIKDHQALESLLADAHEALVRADAQGGNCVAK